MQSFRGAKGKINIENNMDKYKFCICVAAVDAKSLLLIYGFAQYNMVAITFLSLNITFVNYIL